MRAGEENLRPFSSRGRAYQLVKIRALLPQAGFDDNGATLPLGARTATAAKSQSASLETPHAERRGIFGVTMQHCRTSPTMFPASQAHGQCCD